MRAWAYSIRYNARLLGELPPLKPHLTARRIRIGYVSGDFGVISPISYLIRNMFGKHDSSKFEVFAYSLNNVDKNTAYANITWTVFKNQLEQVFVLRF